ncbi:hypothetical protein GF386_04380 [Candidatus Pacearchaeota archaeon]|nr:hypothetical protein [Candidatus Pacearchaeota archaeon]MBD3283361.1 hypothetical protein [Candidatus Pacearchaeota archaeon]
MEKHIHKLPGTFDDVEVKCPKCKSKKVIAELKDNNFYSVIECKECGYKKKKKD